jgi:hypothetical protein
MGFVLARDINKANPREIYQTCSWKTDPKDIN